MRGFWRVSGVRPLGDKTNTRRHNPIRRDEWNPFTSVVTDARLSRSFAGQVTLDDVRVRVGRVATIDNK
ncbi:MAG: hypothetical protein ACYC7E_11120 [Armatimonadota bacterium]